MNHTLLVNEIRTDHKFKIKKEGTRLVSYPNLSKSTSYYLI